MAKIHLLLVVALSCLTALTSARTRILHRTWMWNIDPDLSSPECDKNHRVNVNIKVRPQQPAANLNAEKCTTLYKYFDGQIGSPDIDLFLRCDANDSPTSFDGDQDGKLVFTYKVGKFDDAIDWTKHGHVYQKLNGTLKVSDRVLGDVVDVDVKLGVKVDKKKRIAKYQFIYC
ncbi:hypothetical protein LTR84_004809 [Exophiala bonariae]|uniref:Cyanovirin-N domain-containing protein n=1 Tax=Exophiala bonariae TaxID=1690606 RepID=A0AAV9NRP3_9EURO|nr:hypothetical protein LTR84_004809 [Exophiala bonariae]